MVERGDGVFGETINCSCRNIIFPAFSTTTVAKPPDHSIWPEIPLLGLKLIHGKLCSPEP